MEAKYFRNSYTLRLTFHANNSFLIYSGIFKNIFKIKEEVFSSFSLLDFTYALILKVNIVK